MPSVPAIKFLWNLFSFVMIHLGELYLLETSDARLLKITSVGNHSALLQTKSPWSPTAVAPLGSDVYVLEYLHTVRDVRRDWLPRVRKIAANGRSTMVATLDQM